MADSPGYGDEFDMTEFDNALNETPGEKGGPQSVQEPATGSEHDDARKHRPALPSDLGDELQAALESTLQSVPPPPPAHPAPQDTASPAKVTPHKKHAKSSSVAKIGSSLLHAHAIYLNPLPASSAALRPSHSRQRQRSFDKVSSPEHVSPTFHSQLDAIDSVYGVRHSASRQAKFRSVSPVRHSPSRQQDRPKVVVTHPKPDAPARATAPSSSTTVSAESVTPTTTPSEERIYRLPNATTHPVVPPVSPVVVQVRAQQQHHTHSPSTSTNPFVLSSQDTLQFRRSEGEHKALMTSFLTPIPSSTGGGGGGGGHGTTHKKSVSDTSAGGKGSGGHGRGGNSNAKSRLSTSGGHIANTGAVTAAAAAPTKH